MLTKYGPGGMPGDICNKTVALPSDLTTATGLADKGALRTLTVADCGLPPAKLAVTSVKAVARVGNDASFQAASPPDAFFYVGEPLGANSVQVSIPAQPCQMGISVSLQSPARWAAGSWLQPAQPSGLHPLPPGGAAQAAWAP